MEERRREKKKREKLKVAILSYRKLCLTKEIENSTVEGYKSPYLRTLTVDVFYVSLIVVCLFLLLLLLSHREGGKGRSVCTEGERRQKR